MVEVEVLVVVGPQLFISWFREERSNLQHLQGEKPLSGGGKKGMLVSGAGWGGGGVTVVTVLQSMPWCEGYTTVNHHHHHPPPSPTMSLN